MIVCERDTSSTLLRSDIPQSVQVPKFRKTQRYLGLFFIYLIHKNVFWAGDPGEIQYPPARESHQRDRLVLWNKSQKSPRNFFFKKKPPIWRTASVLSNDRGRLSGAFRSYFRLFFSLHRQSSSNGNGKMEKIRQGNKNVAEHGACCCTNLALGSLARLFGSFSFMFPPFLVWSGVGLVVLVFLIYIPYLHCTSGMVGITWSATRQ